MTFVLLLILCLEGECVEYKPEGEYLVFSDLQECRAVRNAIVRRIMLTTDIGAYGICPMVVRQIAEDQES